ncbi:MAG TPA: response regulator [Methanomassiliicoccaceae archaeon]|jgi:CheY-like chemotaxis protein|nr:response regulator [Euryarchaeota archaeon]HOB37574.1 response regulator [Methanomassiliicoccaceae archaeon]HOK27792.1 response regulator [Methanomassiliicoccaceae archaeon]HOQ26078.1 response regulator [Methanomassiliicoccaceae archaeon]HQA21829.1 response regulator [Methanomassiliicoccaceae archaeon]
MEGRSEILVVDDNPGDALLLHEAFEANGSSVSLSRARDGMDALGFLRRNKSHPTLIVLDIKMPRMGGLEFLKELRGDPSLKDIPVIILTGSDAPEDRKAARRLGVTDYSIKPGKLDGWVALARRLERIACTK